MNGSVLQDRLVRTLLVLLVALAALALGTQVWNLLQTIGDLLLLFFLAWLLAFTLRPLARLLVRFGARSWALACLTVYLGLGVVVLVIILLVIPQMIVQLRQFVEFAPDLAMLVTRWLVDVQAWLAGYNVVVDLTSIYRQQEIIPRAEAVVTGLVQNSFALLTGLASGLFAMILMLFLSFYIMLDDDELVRGLLLFVPERYHAGAIYLGDSIDRSFGGFMRGQLIQALVYGAGTAVVMQLFGLPFVLLASTFAGIVMLIPIIGPCISVIPPLLIVAFRGDLTGFIIVAILLVILQQLVLSVLMPRVMSQSVGVPPLIVFAAVLIGAKVAGIAGAFFSVPLAGIAGAMLKLYTDRRRGVNPFLPAVPVAAISEDPEPLEGPPNDAAA